jgi:acylphosphatase
MQLHVIVRGRVQGVGFRWFVGENARKLGVAGWVRNREDGTVEVAAEGDGQAIESLRARLAKGPSGALVRSVDDLEPLTESLAKPFMISS